MKLNYKQFTLSNGIRVIMVPKKETEAFFIEAMFKVGSRYETDDIRGISHFLEHMAFKGTKKRPTFAEINKEIEQHGGSYNAYTGLDITGYWFKLPYDKYELGIDLLSDILLNSKFDEKEINKEKGVILEEIKMHNDNPRRFSMQKIHELTFGSTTALGQELAGNEKTVRSINKKIIQKFRDHHYKPNNMVIAVGGKINETKTIKLLERYFGKIKGHVEDNFEKNVVVQNSPIVKVYDRPENQQVNIMMSFRTFGRNATEQDKVIASLLAKVLGGMSSSILFAEIRERRGLCYIIGSGTDAFEETGAFEIEIGLDKSKIPEAMKAIFKILRSVKKNGFDAKDLKIGKDNSYGQIRLSLEGVNGWSSGIAHQTLYGEEIDLPEKLISRLKKVTNSDIKRVAREIFRSENFNMVIVGPIDPKKEKEYLKLIKL